MTFISFRNVGVREFQTNMVNAVSQSALPIGMVTPVDFGNDGLFAMNMTLGEQIQDNLRNLVLTNHGERLELYSFGANLKELLSEYSNKEAFDEEAMIRINTAVSQYLPFVQLEGFSSTPNLDDNRSTAAIELLIQYSVPRANLSGKVLKVTLFVI